MRAPIRFGSRCVRARGLTWLSAAITACCACQLALAGDPPAEEPDSGDAGGEMTYPETPPGQSPGATGGTAPAAQAQTPPTTPQTRKPRPARPRATSGRRTIYMHIPEMGYAGYGNRRWSGRRSGARYMFNYGYVGWPVFTAGPFPYTDPRLAPEYAPPVAGAPEEEERHAEQPRRGGELRGEGGVPHRGGARVDAPREGEADADQGRRPARHGHGGEGAPSPAAVLQVA